MITNKQLALAFTQAQMVLQRSIYDKEWVNIAPELSRGTMRTKFICWAIENSGYNVNRPDCVTNRAKRIVQERLVCKDGTLARSMEEWLGDQLGIKSWDPILRDVQAHRHAWLDQLIAEFDVSGNYVDVLPY